MPIWVNADGLVVKSGLDEVGKGLNGPDGRGGWTVQSVGGRQTVEWVIDSTDFTASVYPTLGATKILSDTTVIPATWLLDSYEFFVETAFVGATATLDIGLIRQDRTTAINLTGIASAVAVASLTAGARITAAGALIGTTLANTGLLMVRNNTARFTAGRGILRLNVYNPTG